MTCGREAGVSTEWPHCVKVTMFAAVFILHRAIHTIQASKDPIFKMSKRPQDEQISYYYSKLLGPDWEQLMEEDFVAAKQEVDAGCVTEDINHERRKLSAIILRRYSSAGKMLLQEMSAEAWNVPGLLTTFLFVDLSQQSISQSVQSMSVSQSFDLGL